MSDPLDSAQISQGIGAVEAARQDGLKVAIVGGRLSISIGIDALMTAVRGGDAWDDEAGYAVTNADGFAKDILHELWAEEEDGTTLVHVAIDTAAERALDAGSLNVDYGSDQ